VRYPGNFTVPVTPFSSDAATRALWHFDDTPCTSVFADASPKGNTLTGYGGALITLPDAGPPQLRFSVASVSTAESSGAASVTVVRTGDPIPLVGVSYATGDVTARAGADYTATSGQLSFGCGTTTRKVSVPITDDSATEAAEAFELTLSSPTGGASLGSPSTATVTIVRSDQRPDGWISTRVRSRYTGDDVYNSTGAGQTRTLSRERTKSGVFYVRVYNDGTDLNTFGVRGTDSPPGAIVTYFKGTSTTNITKAMTSASGYKVQLGKGGFSLIRVQVRIKAAAATGSTKTAKVTATWSGDSVRLDAVKAVVKVVR
jgi:hypothetical protein